MTGTESENNQILIKKIWEQKLYIKSNLTIILVTDKIHCMIVVS